MVFDSGRSGYEYSASFPSVNMQNKHGGSIRSPDCYLKKCVKNSLTQYSFYVKNRSNEKKTWERLPKGDRSRQIRKVYVCSGIDLSEVLFHYEIFCGKENKGLSRKICSTVKLICALPGAC